MRFKKICFGILLLAFLPDCSTSPINENNPGSLYEAAENDIKDSRYTLALEKLKKVKNEFPYSKFSIDAELRIADVYFLQELFLEAAASYLSFRTLHPKHPRVSYATYREAKSYFKDMPSNIERDLSSGEKALLCYKNFLLLFEHSPETLEAKTDIEYLINMLSHKDLMIAEFYDRRNQTSAKEGRYIKILKDYKDSLYAKEAQKRLK